VIGFVKSGFGQFRRKLLWPLVGPSEAAAQNTREIVATLQPLHDAVLRAQWREAIAHHPNPLNRCGAKYFSQTDEDGITLEVLRRLAIESGSFIELGVGNGLENNTLILLALGWRGVWIGGEPVAFNHRLNPSRLVFRQDWITLDNLLALMADGQREVGFDGIDVLSIDLDGNDYHFIRAILEHRIRPKLIIAEYNAKFPPPVKWCMAYNRDHRWDYTDHYGVSLASLDELMRRHGYSLICCNAHTGANAFFIADADLDKFGDVPKDIHQLFCGPRFELYRRWGHPPSPKTIEQMLLG